MKYEELPPINRDEVRDCLKNANADQAGRAILRMVLHEPDAAWAESVCVEALQDRRPEVQAAAITGLGHLARLHGGLSDPKIVGLLKELQREPRFQGITQDALDDIVMFSSPVTRAS